MLKKKAPSKKKKWIVAPIAGVLTAAVVVGTLYDAAEVAIAKPSLPGIEKIVENNSNDAPFTILELVDDYSEAAIGFLVDGEEPAYEVGNGIKSIADMASDGERDDRLPKDATNYESAFPAFKNLNGSAFGFDGTYQSAADGAKSRVTYGNFVESTSSSQDYEDTIAFASSDTFYPVVKDDDTDYVSSTPRLSIADVVSWNYQNGEPMSTNVLYADIVTFEQSADSTGDYDLVFGNTSSINEQRPFKVDGYPKRHGVDSDRTTPKDYDLYNTQLYVTSFKFAASQHDAEDITDEEGNVISSLPSRITLDGDVPSYSGSNLYIFKRTEVTPDSGVYEYERFGYIGTDSKFYLDTALGIPIDLGSIYDESLYDGVDLLSAYPDSLAKFLCDESNTDYTDLFLISEYDSQDFSLSSGEQLYIKKADQNSGNGLYNDSGNNGEKVPMVIDGQELGDFGIISSLDDYHMFFYVPSRAARYEYNPNSTDSYYNFVQSYSSATIEEYRYNGFINNYEWFKQYVLDREPNECPNTVVEVVTKRYDEVSAENIDNADLIYIRSTGTISNDIAEDIAKHLLESVKYNKAIVIEGNRVYNNSSDNSDLKKLAIALRQGDLSDEAIDEYLDNWADLEDVSKYIETRMGPISDDSNQAYVNRTVFVFANDVITKGFNDPNAIVSNTQYSTVSGKYLSLQEVKDDIQNEIFYLRVNKIDPATFNDKVTIATCIRHILNYGDRRIITKDELHVLDLEPYYSPVVEEDPKKYFGDNEFSKGTRDLFDKDWFIKNVSDTVKLENLHVKGMGIKEFVGSIEDLNANYDLIYIGLDTQYMNVDNKNSRKTVYNDNNGSLIKGGIVYSHFGDKLKVQSSTDGYVTSEMGLENGTEWRMNGLDLTYEKFRDLTEYIEAGYTVILSDDFIVNKSSTAQVDFKVNTDRITRDSYMYQLGMFILGEGDYNTAKKIYYGENVRTKSDFLTLSDDSKEEFASYLSISKLFVKFDKVPTPYFNDTYDNNKNPVYTYLDMNRDGDYVLEYDVELENKSELTSATYDCVLYIDSNADGRFSENESLRHATFVEEENGNSAPINSDGTYALTTGKKYRVTVKAEGYVGYVPWKLVFSENGNPNVRFAREGACAIPDSQNKPTIKILQITSGFSTDNDRQAGGENDNGLSWTWYGTNLDLLNNNNNREMKPLYDQVQDFNIDVTKISAAQFVYSRGEGNVTTYTADGVWNYNEMAPAVRTQAMINYLHQYDMVVMGFSESFYYPYAINGSQNKKAASYCGMYALREYILSGNSMLFSHDLTTNHTKNTNAEKKEIGWFATRYLRDLQGMDRFGFTTDAILNELSQQAGMGNTYTLPRYESKYDTYEYNKNINSSFLPSTNNNNDWNQIKEGVCLSRLMRYATSPRGDIFKYKSLTAENQNAGDWGNLSMWENSVNNGGNNSNTIYIRSVNRGQITEYPFHIPENEDVVIANTHSQFFQLNLDTDSRDENDEDDAVVWYAISNQQKNNNRIGYYTYNYNDARNNYYIYNKGNITYTGAGHSKVDNDNERKLFINTLVAAYNAGSHAPRAVFKDKPTKYGSDVSAIYEPYDIREGEVGASEINFNFKVINTNLKNTYTDENHVKRNKQIYAQYYVEVPAGTPGSIKILDKNCMVIDPAKLVVKKRADKNGNSITAYTVENPYELDSNCIYSVELNTDIITGNNNTQEIEYGDGEMVTELRKHNYTVYVRLSLEQDGSKRGQMNQSIDSLPSTDSMSGLTISFTDLYELK